MGSNFCQETYTLTKSGMIIVEAGGSLNWQCFGVQLLALIFDQDRAKYGEIPEICNYLSQRRVAVVTEESFKDAPNFRLIAEQVIDIPYILDN